MKHFLTIAGCLFISTVLSAQKIASKIKVGDRVEDMPLTFLKPENRGIKFSDSRGKALILDFWATWCAPCIAGLPKVRDLQIKYHNDLDVILMNVEESREKIERFVAKRESIPASKVTLPIVMADSALAKGVFGQYHLPSYYWITREGVLKYITSGEDVNEGNIRSFISNGTIELSAERMLYTDVLTPSTRIGILWKTELGVGKMKGPTALDFKNSGESAIHCFNNSVIDLYRFAFGDFRTGTTRDRSFVINLPANRVILESNSAFNRGRHYSNRIQPDSLFFYQLTGPDNCTWEKMKEVMVDDLDRCFGYSTSMELRKVKYLSLTIADTTIFANVSGKVLMKISDTDFQINNMTLKEVLRNLEYHIAAGKNFLMSYPIVDESGYKGKVGNIYIDNIDTNSPEILDHALSKFGVRLQLVERPIEMLVIRNDKRNQ